MAIDYEGIKALAAAQGITQSDPVIAAQLAAIQENMSKPKQEVTLDQMIADAKAVQDANNAKLGIVQDPVATAESARITAQLAEIDANRKVQADVPAIVDTAGISALAAEQARINALNGVVKNPAAVAQEERTAAQLAEIDTNRKVQADVPATVDTAGISALAAEQAKINAQQGIKNDPAVDAESARVQAILDKDNTATPEKTVAEEDPMAAALAANQATNEETSPTEQNVVISSEDAALSASQQAKLEDAQAANRATLQGEDFINQRVSTMVKPGQALTSTSIPDWRVKLSLARNGANYLYNTAGPGDILYPLKQSGGVVFPYTPQIQTSYKASYDNTDLTHSNYKMYFYKSSHVEDVQITCDFTAQDSNEASYILAVIHFFKSVTKMFYGQDKAPSAGTPPPLVFLSGYGQYQFNHHPMLISSFTYNLPNDVDYIRASTGSNVSLVGNGGAGAPNASFIPGLDFIKSRLLGASLNKGGATSQPTFTLKAAGEPTYVPTKIQIQLSCLPVVTRNDISKNFSLKDYAAGNLNKRSTGGIW
jgi:hypothetical protein